MFILLDYYKWTDRTTYLRMAIEEGCKIFSLWM